ncbi:tripartite tricarboxylate transporter TctB family protein [Brevibacillus panacihumi]|uniref:Tripartite tricarboxylate transporter TctB family protein n=1 Tax=Brevibacillus panacihumi TaxID=497735 RepID=A0A3M8CRN6_9BACL|nr:tripartite tricarboxylate transporter TctB family protein [Brevibacillus panacihumi]RNB78298.1 tripartite tricarboxylate transporter TctB family protein [Brevibacillus panacihumi]
MLADRVGGLISIIFGGLSLYEALRLYPTSLSFYVGDHIMPGVIGIGLIVLGLLAVFVKGQSFKVEYPDRQMMLKIGGIFGVLLGYCVLLYYLGFAIATFLISIALFRIIGSYNYRKSVLFSAIQTVCVYAIFVYWLNMPFPGGIFNF